jgi:hypothetical protein
MIGLAPRGRPRPWQLAAAVTATRKLFPRARVFVAPDALVIGLSGPVTETEELKSWSPTALRIAVHVFAGCQDDEAIAGVIEEAVPRVKHGVVVEVGIREAEPKLPTAPEKARARGPRLGRRVPPEELRQRLRGMVIQEGTGRRVMAGHGRRALSRAEIAQLRRLIEVQTLSDDAGKHVRLDSRGKVIPSEAAVAKIQRQYGVEVVKVSGTKIFTAPKDVVVIER